MRTSNVYPALTRLATATCIQGLSKGPSSTSFIALSHGFDTSLNDGLSKEVFPCEYVAARATTCPIFQCLVCLCEITLPNYKPIMHFKHSYMHNHAFYVLIHPIILLLPCFTLCAVMGMIYGSIPRSTIPSIISDVCSICIMRSWTVSLQAAPAKG